MTSLLLHLLLMPQIHPILWSQSKMIQLRFRETSVNIMVTTIMEVIMDGSFFSNLCTKLLKSHFIKLARWLNQKFSGDFRQAGRIVGWILGFIVLLLIICVPCVCCIGIWFAGWFGLRQAMARKRRAPGSAIP